MAFHDPSAVLTAWNANEVRSCLREAEAAARHGAYAVGFVAYEAADAFALVSRPPTAGLPLAHFAIFPAAHAASLVGIPAGPGCDALPWTPSIGREEYVRAIDRIKEHIADGETYQLNFTFRLRAPFTGDPEALFRDLVAAQRGDWSAYLDIGTHVVCSASPELFFTLDNGHIECHPMKGTTARGLTLAGDWELADRLRSSSKNRSENVMIVDLVRNDLGRVAQVGSVRVPSLFDVVRYPQQWQMTSTVVAEIGEVPIADIFAAAFPSGSVTGAPKQRSMEIISDIETLPRGLYTGAIGLIAPGARAHFNVAIRTVVVDRRAAAAEFGVGGGIVWDSTPADEYDECSLKASILTARLPEFDLLETLRWEPDSGFSLLPQHLARLHDSAEYFARPCSDAMVRAALRDAVAHCSVAVKVRLLVASDGTARCELTAIDPSPPISRVALARTPISSQDPFLYHKTTHRDVYNRARADHPGVDSVLLWNERGELTEALEANLVVELDGVRLTPPVSCGLLPGTFRGTLLERDEVIERILRVDDLHRATRFWLVNSIRGWLSAEFVSESG